jgi:hypothetical protein
MHTRLPRRHGLTAALLVLSLVALVAGPVVWHEGHGCTFEEDCLACRWAADAVAESTPALALPRPVEPVTLVATELPASVADACPEATCSRGPPLA